MPWDKIGSNQHEFIQIFKTRMNPNEERLFVLPHKIAMIYVEVNDGGENIGNYYFVKPTTNDIFPSGNYDWVTIAWDYDNDRQKINENQCTLLLQSPDPMNVKIIFVCFPDWSEYNAVLE
jgi:hypothetical protein